MRNSFNLRFPLAFIIMSSCLHVSTSFIPHKLLNLLVSTHHFFHRVFPACTFPYKNPYPYPGYQYQLVLCQSFLSSLQSPQSRVSALKMSFASIELQNIMPTHPDATRNRGSMNYIYA